MTVNGGAKYEALVVSVLHKVVSRGGPRYEIAVLTHDPAELVADGSCSGSVTIHWALSVRRYDRGRRPACWTKLLGQMRPWSTLCSFSVTIERLMRPPLVWGSSIDGVGWLELPQNLIVCSIQWSTDTGTRRDPSARPARPQTDAGSVVRAIQPGKPVSSCFCADLQRSPRLPDMRWTRLAFHVLNGGRILSPRQ